MPDLRTRENIGKQTKNRPKTGRCLFWQPKIAGFRTILALHDAEICENLDMLEEFLNDLQNQ